MSDVFGQREQRDDRRRDLDNFGQIWERAGVRRDKLAGDGKQFGDVAIEQCHDAGSVGESLDREQRMAGCNLQGQRQLLPGGDIATGRCAGVSAARSVHTDVVLYGPAPLTVNTWTHLAATYDGTTMRLYVNGAQVASQAQTGAIATSTDPLQIGGDSIYGQYFQGAIDEVRIYNVALTAAEIQADMNTPVGTFLPPPGNLTATVVASTDRPELDGSAETGGWRIFCGAQHEERAAPLPYRSARPAEQTTRCRSCREHDL